MIEELSDIEIVPLEQNEVDVSGLRQVLFMPWDISGTVGQTGNPKSCSSFVVQLRHGWFAIS